MKHLRILRYVDEVARTGSIRKAADHLNVTASAVNRRIMDLEEELGAQLFERRPRGVRLTAAGEVFRPLPPGAGRRSRAHEVADRGSQGIAPRHRAHRLQPGVGARLPAAEIAAFRTRHPMVSFEVRVLDHEQAMTALAAYEVDLVLVFRPPFLPNFQPLMSLEQRIVAVMSTEHPLATRLTVRLRDCANYPVAMPERSLGGRQLLDQVVARSGLTFKLAAESNSFEFLRGLVTHANLISFQIAIGTMPENNKLGSGRARHRRPRCPARQTWCSDSCAPATCRYPPRSSRKSSCARSRRCGRNPAHQAHPLAAASG